MEMLREIEVFAWRLSRELQKYFSIVEQQIYDLL